MMYVQNTSVVSLGPRSLKRSRKMWTQKIESQIFLDLGFGRTQNSQLLNINLAVVFWWVWAVETAKSLKEGVGRRERVSQCWKPVSLKQKVFVIVIYLFVCVSGVWLFYELASGWEFLRASTVGLTSQLLLCITHSYISQATNPIVKLWKPTVLHQGFSSLSLLAFRDRWSLLWEAVLCIVEYLAASLTSTT